MRSVTLLKSSIAHLGGLEKYTLRLAEAFYQKGCSVRLLTTGELPKPKALSSIDIKSMEYSSRLSVFKIKEFDEFCQRTLGSSQNDVIFGLDRNYYQTHIRAGNGAHISYLERRKKTEGFFKSLSFSINPLHKKLLNIEKTSFESPELKTLFTNSHMVKEEILSFYRVDPKKICVIHNGVEWKEMQQDFEESFLQRGAIFNTLNLDPSKFHLLFLGHNFRRKGLDSLLLALSLIKNHSFHLSVVGYDKNIDRYKKLCQTLGLQKHVTFWGQRRDVATFYKMADSLVIPSYYDPFANVTVEALSMGLFVVSSSSNGACEVLTNTSGEIIEELSDPESIKVSILKAFSLPKNLALAETIRGSVRHLDFSSQLSTMVDKTLD